MPVVNSSKKSCIDVKKNDLEEMSRSIQEKFENKSMKQFWNEVRNKKSVSSQSCLIDSAKSNEEIIDIFSNKFIPVIDPSLESENALLNNVNDKLTNSDNKINLVISSETVRKLLKDSNPGCGHDLIHSRLLKEGSDELINNIVTFINLCYRHYHFPVDLLKGDINPIIKDNKKSKCDSSNYRPIMISSSILKLMESHMLEFIKEKIHLDNQQFGFRNNSSTTDATFVLKETVMANMGHEGYVYGQFVDLSKAFDLVDHIKLTEKLLASDLPVDLVAILCSYLRNQTARVMWLGNKGQYRYINKGVRQGGILSPFLFNFYIDDIICSIKNLDIGCKFGISRVNIIAYADDVVLLANNQDDINEIYRIFKQLIGNIKLKINENKSKCVVFRNKKNIPDILKNKIELEIVDQFNYLGHILNYNLDDSNDITAKLNKFYSSFNSIFRSFSQVNIETLLYLFNSYCRPHYGLALWCSKNIFVKQSFKTFKIAFNKSLKKIIDCPSYSSSHAVAEICQQLLLNHRVIQVQVKYLNRLLNSNHDILLINNYFVRHGNLANHLIEILKQKYQVNLYENDIDAIISRIHWVQANE